jgi:hypothetical protein
MDFRAVPAGIPVLSAPGQFPDTAGGLSLGDETSVDGVRPGVVEGFALGVVRGDGVSVTLAFGLDVTVAVAGIGRSLGVFVELGRLIGGWSSGWHPLRAPVASNKPIKPKVTSLPFATRRCPCIAMSIEPPTVSPGSLEPTTVRPPPCYVEHNNLTVSQRH